MTADEGRAEFQGAAGQRPAARLDRPLGPPRAYALFAHCFTCSKDFPASARISRALAERGIAVLRFDFTGLGGSGGEFENSSFSSNAEDLVRAAEFLRERHAEPALLVGHSLGGAALLAAAARIPQAQAVALIGAPAEPAHVVRLFAGSRAELEARGEAEVELAGRRFRVRRELLDDLESSRLEPALRELHRALLVLHALLDNTVGIENASRIFEAARQEIRAGGHALGADGPLAHGGRDRGPSPYDLLLAALGACTSMTLRMYARRKGLPLARVGVRLRHERIHADDCAECDTRPGALERIERVLELEGELDAAQRQRLLQIAERCPVHRTLQAQLRIDTRAEP